MISKQNEIFNKPLDERLKKTTDLDQKVNIDDLIYRYKGIADDVKFDEFDNDFSIIDKIRDGKTELADVKKFKRNLKLI